MDLRQLQEEVKIWSAYNFGPPPKIHKPYRPLLGIIEEMGELYSAFEENEIMDGIGDVMIYMADYCTGMCLDLAEIEDKAREPLANVRWATWLGIVGRLCHAHLKLEQGIRGSVIEHIAEIQLCLGYIIDTLKQFAIIGMPHSNVKFGKEKSFEIAVEETWAIVKKRDWTKNKENGS